MANEEKKDDKGGDKQAAEGSKKNLTKILTFGFIGLNIIVLAGGTFLVWSSTIGFHKPAITEEVAKEELDKKKEAGEGAPIVFTMDPFIVNLEGRPRRTVKAIISVEMLDDKGFEEVVGLGAEARDAVVRLLGSKTFADLESVQGKLFLKDEIATRLNHHMKEGVVKDIYFSELVVQ